MLLDGNDLAALCSLALSLPCVQQQQAFAAIGDLQRPGIVAGQFGVEILDMQLQAHTHTLGQSPTYLRWRALTNMKHGQSIQLKSKVNTCHMKAAEPATWHFQIAMSMGHRSFGVCANTNNSSCTCNAFDDDEFDFDDDEAVQQTGSKRESMAGQIHRECWVLPVQLEARCQGQHEAQEAVPRQMRRCAH